MTDPDCGCPDPELAPLERTVSPDEARAVAAEAELMERQSSGAVDEGDDPE